MMYASIKFEFMGARMRDWMWNRFLCIARPDTSLRVAVSLPWIVWTLYRSDSDSHLKIVYVNGRDIREGIAQSIQSSEVVSRASQPAEITTRQ